ncbi:MAG TPA: YbaB/EbfC family nucleoid-associated protein [Anaerolineae bacterium]|nr:YbaB/EbfC family nucleoid-associated protein [Anaerolineae bacterium]
MAKRSFRGKPKKSKAPNANNMMAKVQAMQEQMKVTQANLENEFVTVSAGGGMVTIEISGHQRVKAITVNPDIVDPEDVETLEDILLEAVNQAIEESQAMAAGKMDGITGGLDMGGLLGGLGL